LSVINAPQGVTDTARRAPSTEEAATAPDLSGRRDSFVVGVDGSTQSIEALRWAARIAAGTGARIEVITTWEPRLGMSGPFVASVDGTYIGPEDDAQALLSRVVDAAYGSDRPPNLTLRPREGDAADILIEASKTAQLLVIGSRGLGEVAGLLLGSVSAHCAEKAQCPVLIMHEPDPS
jgi:nucleotide-binding universal stress UspA family protein